jgi:integrase
MKLSRLASVDHPLAIQFQRAFESLTAALHWDSARPYRGTIRNFLIYLGDIHPAVCSLDQLRRDPHILGWFTHLRSQAPPLAPVVYINRLTHLRRILEELAWATQLPELARLIRREDFPRTPQRLPRALTAQQDQLIQQELLRRNDLPANIFLLLRHTGMRIGECVDLSYDCLHNLGPDLWAIHVPLGKLKTERMVPVDSFVCELVQRLRFFRSFDPLPPDGRLLSRPRGKQALIRQLRYCLHDLSAAAGITTRIVPHQLRHTYASEMTRSSVTLPALMKLLGHVDPKMTMRYVDVTSNDLQREYHLAREKPRHIIPQPKAPTISPRTGLDGVIDSLLFAQHAIEMLRRSLPDGPPRRCLDRLSNRLTKILSQIRKLSLNA